VAVVVEAAEMAEVVEAVVVESFAYVCLCRYPLNQSGLSDIKSKGAFDPTTALVVEPVDDRFRPRCVSYPQHAEARDRQLMSLIAVEKKWCRVFIEDSRMLSFPGGSQLGLSHLVEVRPARERCVWERAKRMNLLGCSI
jgi:hypothetical protein